MNIRCVCTLAFLVIAVRCWEGHFSRAVPVGCDSSSAPVINQSGAQGNQVYLNLNNEKEMSMSGNFQGSKEQEVFGVLQGQVQRAE